MTILLFVTAIIAVFSLGWWAGVKTTQAYLRYELQEHMVPVDFIKAVREFAKRKREPEQGASHEMV